MNHNHTQSNHNSHLWLMLACCLIPIGLIFAVGAFGLSLGPLTPFLPYAIVLLCPLLMFFMMRGMGHDHGKAETHHAETSPGAAARPLAQGSQGTGVRPGAALDTHAEAAQAHHH